MQEKLKSLFIFIGNISGGGAEHVAREVQNSCGSGYFTPILITVYSDGEFQNYKSEIASLITLNFKHCKCIPEHISYLWKLPLGIIKYSILLLRYKPSYSWSLCEPENIINLLSCKINKVNCITSVRGNPNNIYLNKFSRILYKIHIALSNKYAVKINTNSYELKSILIKDFNVIPDKICVIYNPKDLSKMQNIASEPINADIFSSDHLTIVTVGRLNVEKGQWHLIRVFAELRKTIPCKLVICGVGPLDDKLHSLANELGVSNDVLFLGWCPNPYKYMKNSTVFVLPSLSEAQPNALIEAMICGCPVVSADCDYGPREILEDGRYGLLSQKLDGSMFNAIDPLSDAEVDMMNKIESLLVNVELREGYRQLSLERGKYFDKDKIMNEYERMFELANGGHTNDVSS